MLSTIVKQMPVMQFSRIAQKQKEEIVKAFDKHVPGPTEALSGIKSGSSILIGGFGVCGVAENLIDALVSKPEIKDLTIISLTAVLDDFGVGRLINNGQVKRIVTSFIGTNTIAQKLYLKGELEVEYMPEGNIVEATQMAGKGVPGFYVKAGLDTQIEFGGVPIKLENGKPTIVSEPMEREVFNGRPYLLQHGIKADYAFIKAQKADQIGNLVFSKTARNSNADFPQAAKVAIAEVEEIVEPGAIHPDKIHLPGIFIDKLFLAEESEKRIEHLNLDRKTHIPEGTIKPSKEQQAKTALQEKIASRVAKEFIQGSYVTLGLGIPYMAKQFIKPEQQVELAQENGLLGQGGWPLPGEEDPDLVDISRGTTTFVPGSAVYSSMIGFGMYRGGHVDTSVLGAFQVSQTGDFANWYIPGKRVHGMGGAMDFATSDSKLIVAMTHMHKNEKKVLSSCTLPLTGKSCVKTLVTDLGVFDFKNERMVLRELAKGVSLEQIRAMTEAKFEVGTLQDSKY